jgi:hypothetical protein
MTAHVTFSVIPPSSVDDYDLIRNGTGIYKMEIRNTGPAYCRFKGSIALSVKKGPNLAGRRSVADDRLPQNVLGRHLTVDGTSYTKERQRRFDLERRPAVFRRQAQRRGSLQRHLDGGDDRLRISRASA